MRQLTAPMKSARKERQRHRYENLSQKGMSEDPLDTKHSKRRNDQDAEPAVEVLRMMRVKRHQKEIRGIRQKDDLVRKALARKY